MTITAVIVTYFTDVVVSTMRGPMERLKNFIFGEETHSSIKDWIIVSTCFLIEISVFFCLSFFRMFINI